MINNTVRYLQSICVKMNNYVLIKRLPENFLSRMSTSIAVTFTKITDKNFLTYAQQCHQPSEIFVACINTY